MINNFIKENTQKIKDRKKVYILNYKNNKDLLIKLLAFLIPRTLVALLRELGRGSKIKKYNLLLKTKKEIIKKILGSKMILPIEDKGLSKDLIMYGIREENAVEVMKKEVAPGMTIIEAGANIGYYALLEAKLGANKVYAVEPNPNSFRYLKKNIKLNNLKNIKPINIALGDKKGKIPFVINESWNLSKVAMNNEKSSIPIKVDTLDNLFKNKKIDMIRMDVEGYELNILKGATKTIRNNPQIRIFLEFHDGLLGQKKRVEFIKFCKSHNLKVKHYFLKEFKSDREFSKKLENIRTSIPLIHHLELVKYLKSEK